LLFGSFVGFNKTAALKIEEEFLAFLFRLGDNMSAVIGVNNREKSSLL